MPVRRTVVLTEAQDRYLEAFGQEHGLSYSAAMRSALDAIMGADSAQVVTERVFLRVAPHERRSTMLNETEQAR